MEAPSAQAPSPIISTLTSTAPVETCDTNPEELQVLVAEDNTINQRVIKRLLEKINLKHVDIVEDGVKAVEACQNKKYGLILMDIMMPRMNGLEASKTIKTTIPSEKQPNCIIALTANALQDNK